MPIKNYLLPIILIVISCFTRANTITLFSHGIADTYKQAFRYASSYKHDDITLYNERFLFSSPWVTFNYPDATNGKLRVNYKETSFGQENEIGRLHSVYQKTIDLAEKTLNDYSIVLFGLSRGASNVAVFAGIYDMPQVKAIVLESPYFNMGEVIQNMMNNNHLSWLPLSYGQFLCESIFKKYNRHGMSPANMCEHISKDIPILIICSKEDKLVPHTSSVNLYKKLVDCGHQHVYILILDHGRHAKILSDLDGQKYQDVVHAFYKKYNPTHSPSHALSGEKHLAQCQLIL